MNLALLRALDPRKRRALVASFVLGALVMAFFATVLVILPPSPPPLARPATTLSDPSPSLVSSASLPALLPH
ncbi:MAG: hypothetical protein HYR85_21520 [Planctomycetes bacterium]|nr:hypothetical protein [Planctomycetota bacterium]MBI3845865.1 hypothetical protein [Planctomycetota bacterium]